MIRPDEEVLKAICSLQNNPDFKVFYKWITNSSYSTAFKSIDIPQNPQREWMQGRCQELLEIIGHINKARENLSIMQTPDLAAGGGGL